jgi:hypothetical protein
MVKLSTFSWFTFMVKPSFDGKFGRLMVILYYKL